MQFNSWAFVIFLAVVFSIYLILQRHHRFQNILLLVSSYIFYGFWDWRFISLLAISTTVDYFVGRKIAGMEDRRKRIILLLISVATNFTILGFFKYFNFFSNSLEHFLQLFGMQPDSFTLHILLPIGISFYTFQSLSYTIDIYRRKLSPAKNFLDFALFVSFFPQLVAGPIERASRLLPQITSRRKIDISSIEIGLWLILWGFFLKVVVADNAASVANQIFNDHQSHQGLDIIIGIFAFTMQIYGDFAGYSNIARGVSKLLGFDIMINFKFPYLATNPSDFWKRWHISLSTWLRDYLYIPLGGNRHGKLGTFRNIMITMLLGGLWHGASWTFVFWGAYHGTLLIGHRFFVEIQNRLKFSMDFTDALKTPIKIAFMFCLTMIGWLIFRSQSFDQLIYMATHWGFSVGPNSVKYIIGFIPFVIPMAVIHLLQSAKGDLLYVLDLDRISRGFLYAFIVIMIIVFGVRESTEFIYFRF
jgi:D-alanyl-lipoteichoic acid acyltransferase DltB (MBOAT superfamily)